MSHLSHDPRYDDPEFALDLPEVLVDLVSECVWKQAAGGSKPTQEEIDDACLWFVAMYEAEGTSNMSLKDLARMLQRGLPAIDAAYVTDWMEDFYGDFVDEDDDPADELAEFRTRAEDELRSLVYAHFNLPMTLDHEMSEDGSP